jgi:coenzyme F420 hydrogenase subunit beta
MSTKSFQDLIKEVHDRGICQECGGCVSFCSSAEYDVIGFKDQYSPPVYINEDKCLECGICYYICPQTHVLDDDSTKPINSLISLLCQLDTMKTYILAELPTRTS